MRGSHCLRHWAKTQSTIALSSSEAELGGISQGISQGIGLRSIVSDLGIALSLRLRTDTTAAMGMSRRLGVGKIRHLDTSLLWVQDKIRSGDVLLEKVPGQQNPGDALTKYFSSQDMNGHLQRMGVVLETGKAETAPQLTTSVIRSLLSRCKTLQNERRKLLTQTEHEHVVQRLEPDSPRRVSRHSGSYVECESCGAQQGCFQAVCGLCEASLPAPCPVRERKSTPELKSTNCAVGAQAKEVLTTAPCPAQLVEE